MTVRPRRPVPYPREAVHLDYWPPPAATARKLLTAIWPSRQGQPFDELVAGVAGWARAVVPGADAVTVTALTRAGVVVGSAGFSSDRRPAARLLWTYPIAYAGEGIGGLSVYGRQGDRLDPESAWLGGLAAAAAGTLVGRACPT